MVVDFGDAPSTYAFGSTQAERSATLVFHARNETSQPLAPNLVLFRPLDARGRPLRFNLGTRFEKAFGKAGFIDVCAPGARCAWTLRDVFMPADTARVEAVIVEACPPRSLDDEPSRCSNAFGFGDPVYETSVDAWP